MSHIFTEENLALKIIASTLCFIYVQKSFLLHLIIAQSLNDLNGGDSLQKVTPASPPPKPPSPSFELGLSSFPPLPGAAGHLKTEEVSENRLASSIVIGNTKERVRKHIGSKLRKHIGSKLAFEEFNTCILENFYRKVKGTIK